MVIKKGSLLAGMALLALLPGCWGHKKGSKPVDENKKMMTARMVDIPLADNEIMAESDIALEEETLRSFFEDDLEEFVAALEAEEQAQEVAQADTSDVDQLIEQVTEDNDEFAWVEEEDAVEKAFQTVYFDFDRYGVRDDQKDIVETDIQAARKVLADARKDGIDPTIVIEGHACHSAGSAAYNLAISEKRAKAIADWFVSEGVSRENIQIVGRGKEVPAVIEGKAVTGDRQEQWLNRRVEVHVINS